MPDHVTTARFVVDHQDAMEGLFVGGLRLCAAAGLVCLDTIAVDGTKMGTDAALDANHGAEWIRTQVRRLLADAVATDTAETASARVAQLSLLGVEAPEELASSSGRLTRLQAALGRIEAEDRAAATEAAGPKQPGPPRRPGTSSATVNPPTRMPPWPAPKPSTPRRSTGPGPPRSNGRPRLPRPPPPGAGSPVGHPAPTGASKPPPPPTPLAPADRKANVTDPESRITKSVTGWIQGYNAQAAVNEHQIVLAGRVTQDANDVELYQPMVAALVATLTAAGIPAALIGQVLADAGYWSQDNATADGPDRLIATLKDWKQRRAAREAGTTTGNPPEGASVLEAMEHRLRTPEGAAAYARRSHTVEPLFADHKTNRGWRRFRRRGLEPARSEWALMNLSHNLAKLNAHRASSTPAPA